MLILYNESLYYLWDIIDYFSQHILTSKTVYQFLLTHALTNDANCTHTRTHTLYIGSSEAVWLNIC